MDKSQIYGFQRLYRDVFGQDESIDQIILEGTLVGIGIRFIEGTAGGYGIVHGKLPGILIFPGVDPSAHPHSFVFRIHGGVDVGEGLIKVSCGDHIISGIGFFLKQLHHLFRLGFLAFAAVVSFQMEVYEDQFMPAVRERDPVDHQTPFQIGDSKRPAERTGKRETVGAFDGITAESQDPRIDLPDRGKRIRDERHFKVIYERGRITGQTLSDPLGFIDVP